MSLTAARALQDLRPLYSAIIPWNCTSSRSSRCRPGVLSQQRLDPAERFLDQQHLVRIFAAETIGGIGQHGLDLAFGGQIPYPLKSWPLERRPAIACVFEDPLLGDFQIVTPRELATAPPSGSRSCAPRAAAPKRPVRRSLPSSCTVSFARAPARRSRPGTKMSYA